MRGTIIFAIFATCVIFNRDAIAGDLEPADGADPDGNSYSEALKGMKERIAENAMGKNIGDGYLDKIRRRYISRMPYVMIPLIIVPVIKNHEVIGYFTVMPELKGKSVEAYRTLVKDKILFREAIFSDLFDALSRLWLGDKTPSAEVIADRVENLGRDFFKKDLIAKVTLHILNFSAFIQPRNY